MDKLRSEMVDIEQACSDIRAQLNRDLQSLTTMREEKQEQAYVYCCSWLFIAVNMCCGSLCFPV